MVQIESRKMDDSDKMLYWGSWEELVLGGAVLRHGTRSWDAVAAELRSRTFYPYFFTPEVCKARYQDLQKRYSGCASACFEELRKQRVAELKRELEKSDGSIGSLESKLESLKSEKNENRSGDYPSGQTESPPSVGNIARVDFPLKDNSKDGLSAGSFTEETQTDSSPASRIPVMLTGVKAEEGENATSKENIVRKRRGKRKRKDVIIEVGFRDNNKDQVRSVGKEESMENSERGVRCSNDGNQTARDENVDLMSVLNSIIESENLSVFQKRTDSQRRGRYKKTIRRHMDLNVMKNGILEGRITTARELYRDLLLLCNNVIVFYSKESREYKSALSLRNYVRKNYWENIKVMNPCFTLPLRLCCPPPPPVVPKRAHSAGGPKVGKTVNEVSTSQNRESKKGLGGVASPMVSKDVEEDKKRVDQPVKVARSGGSKRVETPGSGRKKPRKK